jgi:hypothetical protein
MTRLNNKALHKLIKEAVEKTLRESMRPISSNNLPQILENMASYAQQCINNGEDVSAYYNEIIKTGLFHDSEGKPVYDDNGQMSVTDEY